jgi:hypothetical protein
MESGCSLSYYMHGQLCAICRAATDSLRTAKKSAEGAGEERLAGIGRAWDSRFLLKQRFRGKSGQTRYNRHHERPRPHCPQCASAVRRGILSQRRHPPLSVQHADQPSQSGPGALVYGVHRQGAFAGGQSLDGAPLRPDRLGAGARRVGAGARPAGPGASPARPAAWDGVRPAPAVARAVGRDHF